jgi:ammonia channel protein AmtB
MDIDFVSSLLVVGGFVVLILCIGLLLLSVANTSLSLRELNTNRRSLLARPFIDLNACLISWLLIGWALANGGSRSLFLGTTEYATTNTKSYELWFYQFTLLYMSVTIFSNAAIARQISGNARFACVLVYSSFIYPTLYHWLWSAGGWASPYRSAYKDDLLMECGVLDSAGSSLIHISSGLATLILMWFVDPKAVNLLPSDKAHQMLKTKNKVRKRTSGAASVDEDALLGTACDDSIGEIQGKGLENSPVKGSEKGQKQEKGSEQEQEHDEALKLVEVDNFKTRNMYAYITAPPLIWLGFIGLNVVTNLPGNDTSLIAGKR